MSFSAATSMEHRPTTPDDVVERVLRRVEVSKVGSNRTAIFDYSHTLTHLMRLRTNTSRNRWLGNSKIALP